MPGPPLPPDRPDELDPDRFAAHHVEVRGTRLEYLHEGAGAGGVPLLALHGWPETRRIWWRAVPLLVAAGFEVVAPDLRGFGGSAPGADDRGDVVAHALDMAALLDRLAERLGHERWVVAGGDLGGPVGVELALRARARVDRMALFNAPLPRLADHLLTGPDGTSLRALPDPDALGYFVRQGRDADGLVAELGSPVARQSYVAEFNGPRGWAAAGAFDGAAAAFHAEPFADAGSFRATLRTYESVFDRDLRTARPVFAPDPDLRVLVLHGTADGVVAPDFGELAVRAYPNSVGPVRLEGCGHFVQWEAAAELVAHLTAFCRDLLG
ncbi:MAG: alpha/beta fold hydrolase [Actinomycetes bacterium]